MLFCSLLYLVKWPEYFALMDDVLTDLSEPVNSRFITTLPPCRYFETVEDFLKSSAVPIERCYRTHDYLDSTWIMMEDPKTAQRLVQLGFFASPPTTDQVQHLFATALFRLKRDLRMIVDKAYHPYVVTNSLVDVILFFIISSQVA